MKRLALAAVLSLAVAAVLAAQTPKYGVRVNTEKGVDYAKFKTYAWTQGQPSASRTIDGQIVGAVDHELSALGMTKAADHPDVLVTYYSLTRTDVNLKGKTDDKGMLPQYTVGTLVVALLEPESRKRLLRLRTDKPIETGSDKLEGEIKTAVAELFSKYPTVPAK